MDEYQRPATGGYGGPATDECHGWTGGGPSPEARPVTPAAGEQKESMGMSASVAPPFHEDPAPREPPACPPHGADPASGPPASTVRIPAAARTLPRTPVAARTPANVPEGTPVPAASGERFTPGSPSGVTAPTVVQLAGDMDILVKPGLMAALDGLTDTVRPDLLLDLTRVTFMDCSGLAVLNRARVRTENRSGRLGLVVSDPVIRRTLRITGLAGLFDMYEDVDSALGGRTGGGPVISLKGPEGRPNGRVNRSDAGRVNRSDGQEIRSDVILGHPQRS